MTFYSSAKLAERCSALKPFGDHEAAQAEDIRVTADAGPYIRVIVLAGNYRARKAPIDRGSTGPYQPMAMRLASAGEVRSRYLVTGPGTSWSCVGRPDAKLAPGKAVTLDALDCSAHATKGAAITGAPRMAKGSGELSWLPRGYDARYWLGPATAAPPAQP